MERSPPLDGCCRALSLINPTGQPGLLLHVGLRTLWSFRSDLAHRGTAGRSGDATML